MTTYSIPPLEELCQRLHVEVKRSKLFLELLVEFLILPGCEVVLSSTPFEVFLDYWTLHCEACFIMFNFFHPVQNSCFSCIVILRVEKCPTELDDLKLIPVDLLIGCQFDVGKLAKLVIKHSASLSNR